MTTTWIIIIVLVVLFGGGLWAGPRYHSGWGAPHTGGLLGLVVMILVVLWLLKVIGCASPTTQIPPKKEVPVVVIQDDGGRSDLTAKRKLDAGRDAKPIRRK